MVVHVQFQRQPVRVQEPRQEVQVRQQQFALAQARAQMQPRAVIQQVEPQEQARHAREPAVRRAVQLPQLATAGMLPTLSRAARCAPARGRPQPRQGLGCGTVPRHGESAARRADGPRVDGPAPCNNTPQSVSGAKSRASRASPRSSTPPAPAPQWTATGSRPFTRGNSPRRRGTQSAPGISLIVRATTCSRR